MNKKFLNSEKLFLTLPIGAIICNYYNNEYFLLDVF